MLKIIILFTVFDLAGLWAGGRIAWEIQVVQHFFGYPVHFSDVVELWVGSLVFFGFVGHVISLGVWQLLGRKT